MTDKSLVEGGEDSYLPDCQTNLVIALDALSLLFCIFINRTAYHLGRYKPSSPVSCRTPRINIILQVSMHNFERCDWWPIFVTRFL